MNLLLLLKKLFFRAFVSPVKTTISFHSSRQWIFAFAGMTAFMLSGLSLSFSPPLSAEVVDKVLATVNQEPITLYDVEKAISQIQHENHDKAKKNGPKVPSSQELQRAALNHLIDESLLSQEIEKQNIQVSNEEVQQALQSILKRNHLTIDGLKKELAAKGSSYEEYLEDIRHQIKRLNFINQALGSRVKVSDEDVDTYYEQNSQKWMGTQEVHIAQIVIPLSPAASDSELKVAQAQAREIYQKAKSGSNFDQLMKQEGAAGSGDLGKVSFAGISPQVANELENLEPGGVTEPIRTSVGFLIVKLLEKPNMALKGSESIKANLRERIYEYKLQEEIKRYVDQLKGKAFIVVKDDLT